MAKDTPKYYQAHEMECIDEMVLVFGRKVVIDFCKCNVWKYRYRAPYKADANSDNAKADSYLVKLKELEADDERKTSGCIFGFASELKPVISVESSDTVEEDR